MKQFVILLYGPPCSGKSATASSLMAKHQGLFRASADRVKWFVSGYGGGPYRKEVSRVVLDMSASALSQGLSLIVEANARILKRLWPEYKAMAEKHGVAYFEVNLEAPLDVLKERLERRLVTSEAKGKKHTLTEADDLERRYNAYLAHRKASIPTFDSSVLTLDDVAKQIEIMVGLA